MPNSSSVAFEDLAACPSMALVGPRAASGCRRIEHVQAGQPVIAGRLRLPARGGRGGFRRFGFVGCSLRGGLVRLFLWMTTVGASQRRARLARRTQPRNRSPSETPVPFAAARRT